MTARNSPRTVRWTRQFKRDYRRERKGRHRNTIQRRRHRAGFPGTTELRLRKHLLRPVAAGIVRRAKELGYHVQAVFIGTQRHDINIERVRNRVREGGHDVAEQEIIRRWADAQTNLLGTWACFDTISILDNSGRSPVTVLHEERGARRATAAPPRWVQNLIGRQGRTADGPER